MFRLMNHIVRRQFRTWDRPSQIAFILAVVLLVILIAFVLTLPDDGRAPALMAAGAVLLTLQGVVLWANRGMVTPYAQAQRYYLAEDYEAARQVLEKEPSTDFKVLTLLGNTYRQLGALDKSKEILTEALQIEPNHQFPLYGFGRTLLVRGEYAEAAEVIQAALTAGAPAGMQVDLAEALYLMGDVEQSSQVLQRVQPLVQDDPPRALMTTYLLYRAGVSPIPDGQLLQDGLAYWQTTAARFRDTPYGQHLRHEVAALQQLQQTGAKTSGST